MGRLKAVIWQSEGCRFDPLPWVCQSVSEQDTQPSIAPDELVGALRGSQLPLVCECVSMGEWEALIVKHFVIMWSVSHIFLLQLVCYLSEK